MKTGETGGVAFPACGVSILCALTAPLVTGRHYGNPVSHTTQKVGQALRKPGFPYKLIFLSVYGTQNFLKQPVFRHRSPENSNNLSVLEHNIGRYSPNLVLLRRLSTFISIQFREGKCVPVFQSNLGDNCHHHLTERSPIRFKLDHDGYG